MRLRHHKPQLQRPLPHFTHETRKEHGAAQGVAPACITTSPIMGRKPYYQNQHKLIGYVVCMGKQGSLHAGGCTAAALPASLY